MKTQKRKNNIKTITNWIDKFSDEELMLRNPRKLLVIDENMKQQVK